MGQFNPHRNRTANGVVVTVGLRVKDYNMDETVVVGDQYAGRCGAGVEHAYCREDHWFLTENGGMFNGERLLAL